MKPIFKISTILIFYIGLVSGVTSQFKALEKLTKEQAIELAEQFIIANGYTHLPADKSKLSYELFDHYENNIDSILIRRQNTLMPKAFCISEDNVKWYVGFLSSNVDLGKLDSNQIQTNLSGRAVLIMKDGTEIRIAHKDPDFSYFKRI